MKASIVGAGPGACTAAMVLAQAGWEVVIFEKGVNHFSRLTDPVPGTDYGNDELKMRRGFGTVDPNSSPGCSATPRTRRNPPSWAMSTICRSDRAVARPNGTPSAHGSGTSTSPRRPCSVPSTVRPSSTGRHLRRDRALLRGGRAAARRVRRHRRRARHPRRHVRAASRPLPPTPGRGDAVVAEARRGCHRHRPHADPVPRGRQHRSYDGRPGCISCGHCGGFGCPIHDRGSGLIPLRHALITGRAELRDQAMVTAIVHDGTTASAVRWVDRDGAEHTEAADFVVLGAGPVDRSAWRCSPTYPTPAAPRAGPHVPLVQHRLRDLARRAPPRRPGTEPLPRGLRLLRPRLPRRPGVAGRPWAPVPAGRCPRDGRFAADHRRGDAVREPAGVVPSRRSRSAPASRS